MKHPAIISLFLFIPLLSPGQLNFNLYRGPYAMARGNIYSVQHQAQSIYGNPAQLAEHPGWSMNASATNLFEILNLNNYQAGIRYHHANLGQFSLGLMQQGTEDYRDQKFQLSYGRKILSKMDVGIQFDWLHQQVNSYGNIDKITVELGAVYHVNKELLIGLHLYNPFSQDYSPQRTLNTGMSVGLIYQLSPRVRLMTEIEKDFFHSAQFKAAIDYSIMDHFALCIGMFSTQNTPNITGGVNYRIREYLTMDLAIVYHPYLGLSSSFGMDCYLRDQKR